MKVIHFDKNTGELKLVAHTTEDLWHVERVLEPGDLVSSKSFRRFKLDEGESGEKKPVHVEVEVEKVEFHRELNRLRITGKILRGTPEEYVQIGSYHTVDVEFDRPFAIIKKEWKKHQLDRLYNAEKSTRRPMLAILVIDDENATFALVKDYGVDFGVELASGTSKRDEKFEEKRKQYMGDILAKLKTLEVSKIIVAGPGFAKDNLKKIVAEREPELAKKIVFETCSTSEKSGVYELLKRGVISKVAGEERVEREFKLMEELLTEISKESGLAAYGIEEIRKAVEYCALKELFVADEALRKNKEIEKLMEEAERKKTKITIFSAEDDAGRQLAGLGGIAGILRFKIS